MAERVLRILKTRFDDGRREKCYYCSKTIDMSKYTTVVRIAKGSNGQRHGHTIIWERLGYACQSCEKTNQCNIV